MLLFTSQLLARSDGRSLSGLLLGVLFLKRGNWIRPEGELRDARVELEHDRGEWRLQLGRLETRVKHGRLGRMKGAKGKPRR